MNGTMTTEQAQADMRRGYYGGAAGIAVSALVWLSAAVTAFVANPASAIATLFFGGMLIHPVGVLLSKLLGRSGTHTRGNPLARLAMEGTVWLLLAIAVAWLASRQRPEWFFVAMMLTIAGRYFTFATLYGLRIYWACGATLAVGGFAAVALNASAASVALSGGLVEAVFAAVVFAAERRRPA